VLHDWPDDKAVEILKQLRDASSEDSVIVIDEIVVPPSGASEKTVLYDMVMMAVMGAHERSEKQWRDVLDAAGLKLREIAIYEEEMSSGLIVAVKA
jgi:demethylsterigmatocystin 6-O-methyltransferase